MTLLTRIGRLARPEHLVIIIIMATSLVSPPRGHATDPLRDVTASNVVWDTPSRDSAGSMPLGNGDIGVNVWVEETGDLLFYLAKSDAWDENGRLVKLGRVRLHFRPPLNVRKFRQELDLATGSIRIESAIDDRPLAIRLWVDAHQPVVRVEVTGAPPDGLRAHFETWRTQPRPVGKAEIYGLSDSPQPVMADPDTILVNESDRVLWCHRNARSIWPATMALQALADAPGEDPLLHRTFGGLVRRETRGNQQLVSVYLHAARTASLAEWRRQIEALAERVDRTPVSRAWAAHQRWWREFWERSWIVVSGTADAESVTRGYARQRFVTACAGRGAYPIKFNGSLFTVDSREPGEVYDADYRRWGGPYWFQNTRLIYWPLLMSGDFEMAVPWLRMYRAALPVAEARSRRYFNHGGACFPETMQFWGAYANDNYGWDRTGKPPGQIDNTYIRHYWSGQLELVAFMLDAYDFTRDRRLLTETLLPLAGPVIQFFDEHYPVTDAAGQRAFEPSQALETWQDTLNPVDLVAGLQWTLPRLLRLPGLAAAERQRWTRLLGELPPLPMTTENGQARLVPAARYGGSSNIENAELYPVFPYRLFGLGKPQLPVGLETFARRRSRGTGGWQQNAIQAALLGLTDEARRDVAQNFSGPHGGSRFAAFWGPNFDWIPDQDHGSVAMTALQRMLLQADDGWLRVLPAWPQDWDVEFKLHAPENTTVECVYRGGRIKSLVVTPARRAAAVVSQPEPSAPIRGQ